MDYFFEKLNNNYAYNKIPRKYIQFICWTAWKKTESDCALKFAMACGKNRKQIIIVPILIIIFSSSFFSLVLIVFDSVFGVARANKKKKKKKRMENRKEKTQETPVITSLVILDDPHIENLQWQATSAITIQ